MYHIDVLPFSIHKNHPYRFDNNKVLMTKIPYTQQYGYHATAIASYIIQTKDDANLQWLLDNMVDGSIHHNFTLPFYPMKKGWVGGLSQGLMASALMIMGEEKKAEETIDSLERNCMNGGVIYEYPGIEILNGWIYALFGIYDAKREKLLKQSYSVLVLNINKYDMGYWSLYGMFNKYPSSLFYHNTHIKQLKRLNELIPSNTLLDASDRWEKYSKHSFNIYRAKVIKYYSVYKNIGLFKMMKRYKQRKMWLR